MSPLREIKYSHFVKRLEVQHDESNPLYNTIKKHTILDAFPGREYCVKIIREMAINLKQRFSWDVDIVISPETILPVFRRAERDILQTEQRFGCCLREDLQSASNLGMWQACCSFKTDVQTVTKDDRLKVLAPFRKFLLIYSRFSVVSEAYIAAGQAKRSYRGQYWELPCSDEDLEEFINLDRDPDMSWEKQLYRAIDLEYIKAFLSDDQYRIIEARLRGETYQEISQQLNLSPSLTREKSLSALTLLKLALQ